MSIGDLLSGSQVLNVHKLFTKYSLTDFHVDSGPSPVPQGGSLSVSFNFRVLTSGKKEWRGGPGPSRTRLASGPLDTGRK